MSFLCFAGVAGALLVLNRGFIQRYPPREQPLLAAQMDIPSYRCPLMRRLADWREEMCPLNNVWDGGGGVLIMGDSHADVAKDAIARLGTQAGVPVYLVKQNCRVIDYGVDRNCPLSQWPELLREVDRHHITGIVLISYWPKDFDRARFDAAFGRLRNTQLDIFLQQSDPASPLLDPGTYLARPDDWRALSSYTRAQHDALRGEQEKYFKDLAASDPRVTLLDPVPLICASDRCSFSRDGVPLYRDDNHLTREGVQLIAPIYNKVFEGRSRSRAAGSR